MESAPVQTFPSAHDDRRLRLKSNARAALLKTLIPIFSALKWPVHCRAPTTRTNYSCGTCNCRLSQQDCYLLTTNCCLQGAMTTTADQSNAGPSYMQQDTQNTEAVIASPESSTASEGRYCTMCSATQSGICPPALMTSNSKCISLEDA